MNTNPETGCWFVYSYDVGPYPIALFNNELDAYRMAVTLGYGNVLFWPFGLSWDEALTLSRSNKK